MKALGGKTCRSMPWKSHEAFGSKRILRRLSLHPHNDRYFFCVVVSLSADKRAYRKLEKDGQVRTSNTFPAGLVSSKGGGTRLKSYDADH